MPLSEVDHLDNLIRHIELVQQACCLLGKRLMYEGRSELGRIIIARGFQHDVSKFYGVEWEYLHAGKDVDRDGLLLSIKQHTCTNDHHPEYWGGLQNMPEVCVAEMVCDWYARSQEFGSSLKDWISREAFKKYQIDVWERQRGWITEFVNILLENHFQ